eukprot:GHVT01007470.1.p1 GENE.GHVT01007470.1~~GHVT01007470.1.p1  ORF type:complete len:330 (+),score=47.73 GHVT01007470.1:1462-2451(+)
MPCRSKGYRLIHHHPFLLPPPQLNPVGYPSSTVLLAQQIVADCRATAARQRPEEKKGDILSNAMSPSSAADEVSNNPPNTASTTGKLAQNEENKDEPDIPDSKGITASAQAPHIGSSVAPINSSGFSSSYSSTCTIVLGGRSFVLPADFLRRSNSFLRSCSSSLAALSEFAARASSSRSPGGTTRDIDQAVQATLTTFDDFWVAFEKPLLIEKEKLIKELFTKIKDLVAVEGALTSAETRLDMPAKQKAEVQLLEMLQSLMNELLGDVNISLPSDAVEMAEACLLYKPRIRETHLDAAKHVLRDLLEARVYIAEISRNRLNPALTKKCN